MTIDLPVFLRAGSILLLSVSLASCTSSPSDTSEASSSPDPTSVSVPTSPSTPTNTAKLPQPEEQSSANPQASDNDEPESSSASEAPPAESGGPTEPPETSVETATVHSSVSPEEPAVPNHSSFQTKSPSLAYLKLGYTDKDVIKRYGTPKDTYPLPDDAETIEIWEYDGLSVGLNERDKVVYIEIASKTVDTGIEKLDYGMKGAQAAELLGIPEGSRTNVLSLEVSGGWLKLDLDPDTQNVLALKLIDRNL